MIIAVDFDGVIAKYTGFEGKGVFKEPIPGAKEALGSEGHKILINTSRLEVDEIAEYLNEFKIPYDYINYSPINHKRFLHPAKQQADVYIDDRNICFMGKWNEDFLNEVRRFTPWWKKRSRNLKLPVRNK
jgi:hypothetical protein